MNGVDMFEDELFLEAINYWDMQRLYQQIEDAKPMQLDTKQLKSLEKAILRGFLCGYGPIQIASNFPSNVQELVVLYCWDVYQYVKNVIDEGQGPVKSYIDIPYLLEAAGYRQNKNYQLTR
jgi:hypothetical protein